jgi:hypothetical protein
MHMHCGNCIKEQEVEVKPINSGSSYINNKYATVYCKVCKIQITRVKKCHRCGEWGYDSATHSCINCQEKIKNKGVKPIDSNNLEYQIKFQLLRSAIESYMARVEQSGVQVDSQDIKSLLEQL